MAEETPQAVVWEGGDGTGRNPTDRGKSGVKRHVLSDGRGVPVAVTVSAANVNDNRVAEQTLDSVLVKAGRGLRRPEHLCLDKGYDDRKVRAALSGTFGVAARFLYWDGLRGSLVDG
ncbi:MAG: IS4/IS5 family transposase [Deltaproteobacteria bacterium]|nr:MAG: IS4/IS5 family transposase [Deltaproteobacteria bacterium]